LPKGFDLKLKLLDLAFAADFQALFALAGCMPALLIGALLRQRGGAINLRLVLSNDSIALGTRPNVSRRRHRLKLEAVARSFAGGHAECGRRDLQLLVLLA